MGNDQELKGTQSTTYPSWYTDMQKKVAGAAEGIFKSPSAPYTGQLVAPMSSQTTGAIGELNNLHAPTPSNERIVDENGKLGAISDYTNPFTDAALQPALREIQKNSDKERSRISSMRMPGGGYGDARHGVLEAENYGKTAQAIGDTTARTNAAAYDTAMSQRGADLSRFSAEGQAGFNNTLTSIQARLAGGQMTQQQAQNEMNAAYAEFLRLEQEKMDKFGAYANTINGLPVESTTTQYGEKDHPFLQGLGALGGAFLGSL